jgi:tetratricopeptide (TPR) repeat protein
MSQHNSGVKNQALVWPGFVALVVLCCWIFFGNIVEHPLDIHDVDIFADNLAISADFSHFLSPEKKVAGGRPLTDLVRWLTYLAVGNSPSGFHFLGLLFHASASILVAVFCRRLGAPVHYCFTASILFLLNVTHFQAVHWITGLDYPLALTVGLASLVFYSNFRQSHRRRDLCLFFCTLTAAVFAQPTIAVLLVFCVFWSWQEGDSLRVTLRTLLPLPVLLLLANLVVIQMTSRGFTTWLAIESNATKDFAGVVVSMAHLLVWYLSRLITTAHWVPIVIYEHQNWEMVVGAAVLMGLLVAIWRSSSLAAIWAKWILLCLGPFILLTTDVVFTFGHLLTGGSRFLYFASVGSSALLAWLIQQASESLADRIRVPAKYLHTAFLVALMISSYGALRKVEAISFYSSGRNYIAIRDPEKGVEQLRRAIAQSSDTIPLADAYSQLCLVLLSLGEDAEPTLKDARKTFPDDPEFVLYELAIGEMVPSATVQEHQELKVDVLKGHLDENVHKFMARTYYNMGVGFDRKSKVDLAVLSYRRALQFDPHNTKAIHNLALALSQLGRQHAESGHYQDSIDAFLQAMQIEPEMPLAHFGLSYAYLLLEDRVGSTKHYEILKNLDPKLASQLSSLF